LASLWTGRSPRAFGVAKKKNKKKKKTLVNNNNIPMLLGFRFKSPSYRSYHSPLVAAIEERQVASPHTVLVLASPIVPLARPANLIPHESF